MSGEHGSGTTANGPTGGPAPGGGPIGRPVSRAGAKLAHALDTFGIDPAGLGCADLGCSTGGFTQQLLQRGAAFVVAVDTAYGVLDYSLRRDRRTIVLERRNALHTLPPDGLPGPIELVTIDLGWTVQRLCVPAALRWLERAAHPRIVTLVKPHYEAKGIGMEHALADGIVSDADALTITERVLDRLVQEQPVRVLGLTPSPIRGSKSDRRAAAVGNLEYLALLTRRAEG
jgi:23S rRNA (cytidine1920-2'-O)/16S rRNA (cytidine1409-2'-O)-methyltransferase